MADQNSITIQTLIACGLAPTQARQFAQPLSEACEHFVINTPIRQAGLIGQCRVESANFCRIEENMHYTTTDRVIKVYSGSVKTIGAAYPLLNNPKGLANRVYANRLGNGSELSGDGWKFHGRGLIQLTGRDNYAEFASSYIGDSATADDSVALFESDPIKTSCMSAAWFFVVAGCLPLADSSNWDAITRKVNGPAMLEAATRKQYSQQASQALR